MSTAPGVWPSGWTRQQRSTATIVASAATLVLFMWLVAKPLALLPDPVGPVADEFAKGTRTTVWLTLWSGVLGIAIGIATAVAKLAPFPPLRWAADLYVWVMRGTPLLVQIFFAYFALPELVPGLELSDFSSAVIALALNVGAYNAEAIRAGILAVPKGQSEAARALGLSPVQTFRDVVFPQAFKISLPSLVNNVVALLKDSSLAYAIGVVELANVGGRLNAATFEPVPTLATTAAIYLVLTTVLTRISGAIEARLDVEQRR